MKNRVCKIYPPINFLSLLKCEKLLMCFANAPCTTENMILWSFCTKSGVLRLSMLREKVLKCNHILQITQNTLSINKHNQTWTVNYLWFNYTWASLLRYGNIILPKTVLNRSVNLMFSLSWRGYEINNFQMGKWAVFFGNW